MYMLLKVLRVIMDDAQLCLAGEISSTLNGFVESVLVTSSQV